MAGPAKKPKKAVQPASSDNEVEESESEGFEAGQEIEATFEGRNPEGQDYHGIKQLLQQLFLKAHIDLSQMTDMVIAAKAGSTVLHQCDNDDAEDEDDDMDTEISIFGVTSLINLTANKETPCVQHLFKLVEDLSKEYADINTYNTVNRLITENNNLGFIINERFVNIPAKVSIHMLKCLQDDLQRIKKKDPSYNLQYFFMICKICKSKDKNDKEVVYLNDEERIVANEADVSFEFSVANESDTGLGGTWDSDDEQMIPYRKVVAFKADKLPSILQKIESYVGGNA